MATQVDFGSELKKLQSELAQAQAELKALQDEYKQHNFHTQSCRDALRDIRLTMAGKLPGGPGGKRRKASALPKNAGTNRPSRGARKEQLEALCREIGAETDTFRTIDVIRELAKREGDISSGTKSYTYAVLAGLEKDGVIVKEGRGTWSIVKG